MLNELDSLVLLQVDNKNFASIIAKELNLTMGSCLKHIKSLEKQNLINRDDGSRERVIKLTRNGQVIQEHLLVIRHILCYD